MANETNEKFSIDTFLQTFSVESKHHLIVCKALELCCMQSIELLGVIGHSECGGLKRSEVTRRGRNGERRVRGSRPHQAGAGITKTNNKTDILI